ncbi:MAG: hypothetical protein AAF999_16195 [Pseudomonadota bacterium]
MTGIEHLRGAYHDLEQADILRAPVQALIGVTEEQKTTLATLGIETIFDLATSRPFADARRLVFPTVDEREWRAHDLFPNDLLNRNVKAGADVADLGIEDLMQISARKAALIKVHLAVNTIGELAVWPSYLAARALAGIDLDGTGRVGEDPELPAELLPTMNDQASEKVFYTVYSETREANGSGGLTGAVSLDQIATRQAQGEATVGHILRYEQSWTPVGLTLGNLLHSLALAPGEATRVAITSWGRQQSASTSEDIAQNEALSNLSTSARAISEITSAVAREASEGFSSMNNNTNVANSGTTNYGLLNSEEALTAGAAGATAGGIAGAQAGGIAGVGIGGAGGAIIGGAAAAAGSWGIGTGGGILAGAGIGALAGGAVGIGSGALVGGAAGGAMGFMGAANFGSDLDSTTNATLESVTVTSTDGTREVESEMMQSVSDQTQQQASSARSRTASIVQEVSQSESENVSTRVVANYNHMHAMTVQYFEVVQIYRQETRLLKSDPCVYVPVGPVRSWTPELIRKYRGQLLAAALSPDFAFHLLAAYGTVGLHAPSFARMPVEELRTLSDEALMNARHVLDTFIGANPHNDWRLPDDAEIVSILGTNLYNGWSLFDASIDKKFDHRVYALMRGQRTREEIKVAGLEPALPLSQIRGLEFQATLRPGETEDLEKLLKEPIRVSFRIDMKCPGKSGTIAFHAHGMVDSSHIVRQGRGGRGAIVFPIVEIGAAVSLKKALDHLNENTEWYSRQILRRKDKALARALVDNLAFGGSVLGEHVDPEPVAINGDRLVFKLQSAKFRPRRPAKTVATQEVVPVGTGGVFAEAVLGRANSAEKIDLTRFWNWQDSPIPLTPPEISPVATGSRAQAVNLIPGRLDAPLVQNMDPRALPDPQGTLAVLNTIQQRLFEDMSGILETAQVAQTALQQAATASVATGDAVSENLQKGMEQTGRIVEQASKMVGEFGTMVAEKSLDVLNSGVSGALGSSGGLGGLMSGASGGAMSTPGTSGGGSGSAARGGAGVSGGTSGVVSGGLTGSATGIGGALNEARKFGGNFAGSGATGGSGPSGNALLSEYASDGSQSLPSEIIKRATGVQTGSHGGSGRRAEQDGDAGSSLQDRVNAELKPLVTRATRADSDYDALLEKTLELIEFAQFSGGSDTSVLEAVGDALHNGWKAAVLRAADRFNAGDHDAVHRMMELDAHRALLPTLINGAGFDLQGMLRAEIAIEDVVVPAKVTGGEEITITGRVMESLSDGTKVPAIGAEVSLTSKPTLQEHQRTSADVEGRFSFVINHGVPPAGFDGVHRFAGWFDLELDIAAHSGRTPLVAEKHLIVPGEISVKLIGAFDNETGEERLIGSVVQAGRDKELTLQFRAMIAGQPLNRDVQMQASHVAVNGEGLVETVTNPDGSGEFVVVFRPTGAVGDVAYVSPVVHFGGYSQETPLREAPGFAALNII